MNEFYQYLGFFCFWMIAGPCILAGAFVLFLGFLCLMVELFDTVMHMLFKAKRWLRL